jgi:hypothetical protein
MKAPDGAAHHLHTHHCAAAWAAAARRPWGRRGRAPAERRPPPSLCCAGGMGGGGRAGARAPARHLLLLLLLLLVLRSPPPRLRVRLGWPGRQPAALVVPHAQLHLCAGDGEAEGRGRMAFHLRHLCCRCCRRRQRARRSFPPFLRAATSVSCIGSGTPICGSRPEDDFSGGP